MATTSNIRRELYAASGPKPHATAIKRPISPAKKLAAAKQPAKKAKKDTTAGEDSVIAFEKISLLLTAARMIEDAEQRGVPLPISSSSSSSSGQQAPLTAPSSIPPPVPLVVTTTGQPANPPKPPLNPKQPSPVVRQPKPKQPTQGEPAAKQPSPAVAAPVPPPAPALPTVPAPPTAAPLPSPAAAVKQPAEPGVAKPKPAAARKPRVVKHPTWPKSGTPPPSARLITAQPSQSLPAAKTLLAAANLKPVTTKAAPLSSLMGGKPEWQGRPMTAARARMLESARMLCALTAQHAKYLRPPGGAPAAGRLITTATVSRITPAAAGQTVKSFLTTQTGGQSVKSFLTSPIARATKAPLAPPTVQSVKAPLVTPTAQPAKAPVATPTAQSVKSSLTTPSVQPDKAPVATPTAQSVKSSLATPSVQPDTASLATPSNQTVKSFLTTPTVQAVKKAPLTTPIFQVSKPPLATPALQVSKSLLSPATVKASASLVPSSSSSSTTAQPTKPRPSPTILKPVHRAKVPTKPAILLTARRFATTEGNSAAAASLTLANARPASPKPAISLLTLSAPLPFQQSAAAAWSPPATTQWAPPPTYLTLDGPSYAPLVPPQPLPGGNRFATAIPIPAALAHIAVPVAPRSLPSQPRQRKTSTSTTAKKPRAKTQAQIAADLERARNLGYPDECRTRIPDAVRRYWMRRDQVQQREIDKSAFNNYYWK